jgi:hypothetical protein
VLRIDDPEFFDVMAKVVVELTPEELRVRKVKEDPKKF